MLGGRGGPADTHCLGSATVTAASGAECTLSIVWERASGAGMIHAKPMHQGLGVAAGSWPSWPAAQERLKQLGARLCTAPEKRLLLTLPGGAAIRRDVLVVGLDAASQWLRTVGQQAAAEQLSRQQPPLEQPAARRIVSVASHQMQRAQPQAMPSIPSSPPWPASQLVVAHPVPQLQDDWRVGSRRADFPLITDFLEPLFHV